MTQTKKDLKKLYKLNKQLRRADKEKNYIMQDRDFACYLITMMNFTIERDGKCPIKYHSKKFWKLNKECGGNKNSGISSGGINSALKQFKITADEIPENITTMDKLNSYFIKKLNTDKKISFCLPALDFPGCYHNVLITDYNSYHEVFKVINANVVNDYSPVEYLTWKQLTKSFYYNYGDITELKSKKEKQESINHGIYDTLILS